ncbi:hypothetical protein JAAARDRAFT_693313 [Jaapia argillacea MUCL 33604]|uniref:Swiss Army Knife RNA repair protein HAD domain-containing protein n=1 Tax=Jaapia argillacea MUCL 33604 TaxID=933084 RepID=A0A067PLZ9_9AGAM|nr:hypothetical protein JAAARDRAFT_693313 [Jaapia argillacea MUCL 33604]
MTPSSHEHDPDAGSALRALSTSPPDSTHPTHAPVIAIDLDDVLSETNVNVAAWHNKNFGTNMTLSDFHYYHYWKNPYWGTPEQTYQKVKAYYAEGEIINTTPVPGALRGVQKLRDLGYRLIVVTARQKSQLDNSWAWLEKHFTGLFESVICTGQFEEAIEGKGHELVTKLTKAEVCQQLSATLIIDDSIDNAISCASYSHPTPVLLFGDYEWNKRPSVSATEKDQLGFDERCALEPGKEWWKDDEIGPSGLDDHVIWRVRDWVGVVGWVEEARGDGRI